MEGVFENRIIYNTHFQYTEYGEYEESLLLYKYVTLTSFAMETLVQTLIPLQWKTNVNSSGNTYKLILSYLYTVWLIVNNLYFSCKNNLYVESYSTYFNKNKGSNA